MSRNKKKTRKESLKKSTRTQLKWDYSDTQIWPQGEKGDESTGTKEPTLLTILTTIKQMQEENRNEGRRARVASKKVQTGIRKLNKTCEEIADRLTSVEMRTEALEADVETIKTQGMEQGAALMDAMTKLEDYENRQRRNNLRFLGIPEGLEGTDPRNYMVKLLKDSFPDQTNWDWEMEIEWAHCFPLFRRKQTQEAGEKQRVMLVFIGNFLLRQMIFDKARPNAPKVCNGVSFFVRLDFAHATVERRWHLGSSFLHFKNLELRSSCKTRSDLR